MLTKLPNRLILLVFLCTMLSSQAFGVALRQSEPLNQVLEKIAQKYDVIFTYNTRLLEDISIHFEFKPNENIESAVNRALSGVNLRYKQLSDKYYIVYNKNLTKKRTLRKLRKKIKDIEKLQNKSAVFLQSSSTDVSTNIDKIFKSVEKLIALQKISGTVTDNTGLPLIGVNILEQGTGNGTSTDLDGKYELTVNEGATLVFSYTGYADLEVKVESQTVIDIVMEEGVDLEEVVVVGFGTVKKEAVVGAVSSVNPSELKIPASNLTTALAGRVSGLVSYQTSGEPGADNAQFFVRGVASFNNQNGPLILIDGVELTIDDLARLQPDDIASFSILQDPTTTAIYGARGANGIILVTTRTGFDGPAKVSLRMENSISTPSSLVELADPITHMRLQNEAERTRGRFPTFTESKIRNTERGLNPNVFPAIDWYDELFKKSTTTQRVNLNVSGGGKKVRYYVAGSLTQDNGLLKSDPNNNFQSNINLKRYLLRGNINIDLSETTEMIVRLHSTLDDLRGPLQGGSAIYNAAVRTSPVRFQPVIEPDAALQGVPHIIFGNDLGPRNTNSQNVESAWFNPYAELQRGYRDYRRQLSLVQLEFKQNLDFLTPGLSARFLGNANNTSAFENRRSYIPYFYRVQTYDQLTDSYTLARTSEGLESLELENSGERENTSVLYMEAAVNYDRVFADKHGTQGLLVMIGREYLDGNPSSVQLSLPSRNIGVSGRFTYSYDSKYFAEFNFGYNGSERFASNNRFGFFPSFGVGWNVSKEPFFGDFNGVINRLKLRASFGWVGNDNIGNDRNDRFFYLSEVDLASGGSGANFGRRFDTFIPGVSISRYANNAVTWEKARKLNIGLDLDLFENNAVSIRVDAFNELRTDILQTRADIPSTLGLQAALQTNVGEVRAWGINASLDANHSFNRDLWVSGRATFTYADNEYKVFEEPNYAAIGAPWVSNIGNNVNVHRGFIAERLFVDDEEAISSPTQFGTPGVDYGGGDIKYRDLNGDGIISDLDRVPLGNPTVPKVTFGFGFSVGYKKFDLNAFFQGLAETSFFINPVSTGPFINSLAEDFGNDPLNGVIGSGNGRLTENGLLQAYADSYWSEENRDIYALWPRLSTEAVPNNIQRSTWWLRDGSFIRLKQLEVGYTFIDASQSQNKVIKKLRIYATGTNLFTWSKFDLWDPELGGNGLNYPLQRVYNFGVNVGF